MRLTASSLGASDRQNTIPVVGSAHACLKSTPSSPWMSTSAWCASLSPSGVIPCMPLCTSMYSGTAPPFDVGPPSMSGNVVPPAGRRNRPLAWQRPSVYSSAVFPLTTPARQPRECAGPVPKGAGMATEAPPRAAGGGPAPAASGLDRYFHITERGSTVRTEIVAGLATFLTMSYILFVNPSIIAGVKDHTGVALDFAQVLTVTAL